MEDQYKDAIIEAIPAIRIQRKRPYGELIAKYVASKYGLDQNRAMVVIENLLTEAVVYVKVNRQGKESFYVSKGSAKCATQDESVVVFNDKRKSPSMQSQRMQQKHQQGKRQKSVSGSRQSQHQQKKTASMDERSSGKNIKNHDSH